MSVVRKGNKELTVDLTQVGAYLKDGFDEIDEKTGKVISASPARIYSSAEVEKLRADYDTEIAMLKKKLAKKEKGESSEADNAN